MKRAAIVVALLLAVGGAAFYRALFPPISDPTSIRWMVFENVKVENLATLVGFISGSVETCGISRRDYEILLARTKARFAGETPDRQIELEAEFRKGGGWFDPKQCGTARDAFDKLTGGW